MLGDYERLRTDALAGDAQGWRWGGSVLARAGVAGWIRIWSEHAAANEETTMNGSASMRPAPALARERLNVSAGVSATADAPGLPRDPQAIVALLALMLRGLVGAQAGAMA